MATQIEYWTITPGMAVHSDLASLSRLVQTLLPFLSPQHEGERVCIQSFHQMQSIVMAVAWANEDPEKIERLKAEFYRTHPWNAVFSHAPYLKPAGMAVLCLMSRPWKHGGRVEDVVVHPDYRRRGIAEQLMNRLIHEATQMRLSHLSLTSNDKRPEAQALYHKLGFQTVDTTVFRLPLKLPV